MKKMKKFLFLFLVAALCLGALSGCGGTLKVTFETNGGTALPEAAFVAGEAMAEPKAPEKAHAEFGGWYSDSGLSSAFTSWSKMPSENLTLYAKWNNMKYDVVLLENGGTKGEKNVLSVEYDAKLFDVLPMEGECAPAREGYTLIGWSYTPDGVPFTAQSTDKMTEEVRVLYAQWSKTSYQLKLDPGEGGTLAGNVHAVAHGMNVKAFIEDLGELALPTKGDSIFEGWTMSDGSEIPDALTMTGALTLVAKWTDKATLTFDVGDAEPIESQRIAVGSKIIDALAEIAQPSVEGYTFMGWSFDDPDNTDEPAVIAPDDATVMPDNGKTVYAVFEKDEDAWVNLTVITPDGTTVREVLRTGFTMEAIDDPNFAGWYFRMKPDSATVVALTKNDDGTYTKTGKINNLPAFNSPAVIANYATPGITWTQTSGKLKAIGAQDTLPSEVIVPSVVGTYIINQIGDSMVLSAQNLSNTNFTSPFKNNTSVTKVTLPMFLRAIGDRAFEGCTSLTDVTVPGDLPFIVLANAFEGCANLKNIDLGNASVIGYKSFLNCTALANVDLSGVRMIGSRAFENTAISSATLSAKAEMVYENAFKAGAQIDLSAAAGEDEKILNGALYSSDGTVLKRQILWKGTMPNDIPESGLEEFRIAAGTVTIGANAFSRPAAESVGSESACNLYSPAVKIIIPSSVQTIGGGTKSNGAFYKFENMGTRAESASVLVIEDGVTSITDYAFETSGNGFTSISLPASVTEIGTYAFAYLDEVTAFTIAEGSKLATIGASAFWGFGSGLTLTLPETVTALADTVFRSSGFTKIVAPGVKSIGNSVFESSEIVTFGSTENVFDLSKVTEFAPDALMGAKASSMVFGSVYPASFAGMTNLKQIGEIENVIDLSLFDELTENMFNGCTSIVTVKLGEHTALPANIFYGCTSLVNVNSAGDATGINLSTIDSIADGAFRGCTAIEAVYVKEGVRFVGGASAGAFENCTKLMTFGVSGSAAENVIDLSGVVLDKNESGEILTKNTFKGCKFTKVLLPENFEIAPSMFYNCSALVTAGETEKVVDLSKVKDIGASAFYGNSSILKVVLNDSLTKIADSVFEGCTKLASVNLPSKLVEIGGKAFKKVPLEGDLILPETLTTLGKEAFNANSASYGKLTSVVIPAGLELISNAAFKYQDKLQKVTISASPTIDNYAFDYVKSATFYLMGETMCKLNNYNAFENGVKFVLRADLFDDYRADAQWKKLDPFKE